MAPVTTTERGMQVHTQTYLTDIQLAERFRVSRATIWRWSAHGIFPRPIKLGPAATRWRQSDVLAWEREREAARAGA